MILTDREIQIALEFDSIVIDPLPEEKAYSSTSVDLTLDETLSEFRDAQVGINVMIDPSREGYTTITFYRKLPPRCGSTPNRVTASNPAN
ncbi:hypothetical protein [Aurantimonas sp. Leaf443]|uniref:hypothetical protein n=1 Tax=Aurantimonas sp. Leaf443 TaxID=1736378 RepID=UPI000AACB95B|nr:hypothetical protein [Aurantimonas sp. Leaf443]